MATISKERFEQFVSTIFDNFTAQNGLYRGHVDDKQKLKEFEDNLCHLGLKFSIRTSTYRQEKECLSAESDDGAGVPTSGFPTNDVSNLSSSCLACLGEIETSYEDSRRSQRSKINARRSLWRTLTPQQPYTAMKRFPVAITASGDYHRASKTSVYISFVIREEERPQQQVEGQSSNNTSINVENCTSVQPGKTQAQNAEQRLLFHQERGICIPDTGIPFSIIGTTSKQCIYGPHYWAHENSGHAKQSEGDDRSVRKQRCRLPSKKKGCPSYFNVKCARYFPDFKVENSSPNLSKWKLRCARHKALNSLRAALDAGSPTLKSYDRFYIEVSDISQHNHELKGPDPTRKIHPGLVSKIQSLVKEGITEFQEVKCQLTDYITSDILNGCEAQPSKSNRAFFPSDLTIRNLVQSTLDQQARQRECILQDSGAKCRAFLEKLTDTTHQIKDPKTMQEFLRSLEQLWAEMESKVHLDKEMVSAVQSIEEGIGHAILNSLASKRPADEITLVDLPSSKRLETESVNIYNFYSDMG